MLLSKLLSNELFLNSAGAAAGGFVGVILLFLAKWLIEWSCSRPKLIITYQCASEINKGQKGEVEGELKHHHGKRIESVEDLTRYGIKNPVWEWNRERTADNPNPQGGSIFYGPYSTDLTEPGLYEVIFRICGRGFTKPQEVTSDVNLLMLDVNCILPELIGFPDRLVAAVGKHEDAAKRFVRVSQLAKGGWQDFKLQVWSSGRGTWEFRAWAYDGAGKSPDNFDKLDKNVKIFFDTVTITKIAKMNLPPV